MVGERLTLETPIIKETKEEVKEKSTEEIIPETTSKGNAITGAVIGFAKGKGIYLGVAALVLVIIIGIWQSGNYIKGRKGVYF